MDAVSICNQLDIFQPFRQPQYSLLRYIDYMSTMWGLIQQRRRENNDFKFQELIQKHPVNDLW